MEGGVLGLVEAGRVEDVELGFGAPVGGVGDAGALQVVLRLAGDVAGIAAVGLAGHRVLHEAVEQQRLVGQERVLERCLGIGHQDHVRLLDLLEAADRRAVEADTVLEHGLVQLVSRDGEVLHLPGQVAEAQVDELITAVGNGLQDVGRCLGHGVSSQIRSLPLVPGSGFGTVAGM